MNYYHKIHMEPVHGASFKSWYARLMWKSDDIDINSYEWNSMCRTKENYIWFSRILYCITRNFTTDDRGNENKIYSFGSRHIFLSQFLWEGITLYSVHHNVTRFWSNSRPRSDQLWSHLFQKQGWWHMSFYTCMDSLCNRGYYVSFLFFSVYKKIAIHSKI